MFVLKNMVSLIYFVVVEDFLERIILGQKKPFFSKGFQILHLKVYYNHINTFIYVFENNLGANQKKLPITTAQKTPVAILLASSEYRLLLQALFTSV